MCGLKHQKEKRSMDYFAGLDVSVNETSVCIVDDAGKRSASALLRTSVTNAASISGLFLASTTSICKPIAVAAAITSCVTDSVGGEVGLTRRPTRTAAGISSCS